MYYTEHNYKYQSRGVKTFSSAAVSQDICSERYRGHFAMNNPIISPWLTRLWLQQHREQRHGFIAKWRVKKTKKKQTPQRLVKWVSLCLALNKWMWTCLARTKNKPTGQSRGVLVGLLWSGRHCFVMVKVQLLGRKTNTKQAAILSRGIVLKWWPRVWLVFCFSQPESDPTCDCVVEASL